MEEKSYVVHCNTQPDILWKNQQPFLRTLDIELTERCNNNCIHCCINQPENDLKSRKKELTTREWQSILDQAADLGALSVRFTGGEPLLREDFTDLYLYARQLGLRVLVFTNARLITPEMADLFARIPPLEKIAITVYGMKPDSYDSVTQKRGSYSEFQRGINLLLERKIPFTVKGTVFPETRPEMEDLISWAATIPGMDSLPAFILFLELRHRRDSPTRNRHISDLRLSPQEGLKILTMNPDLYKREMTRFCKNFLKPPSDYIFNCNHQNALCVDAYGQIQFCLGLRHPETVFDFREYNLKDMLTRFIPEFRKQKSSNPDFLNRCGKCFLRGLCEQCPAKSWIEHGSLDRPVDYVCQVAHEQAVYLGLLNRGEKSWQVKDWQGRIDSM